MTTIYQFPDELPADHKACGDIARGMAAQAAREATIAERQRFTDAIGPELQNLHHYAEWYDEDHRDIGPILHRLADLLDGDTR
jgi:hypothetical protein